MQQWLAKKLSKHWGGDPRIPAAELRVQPRGNLAPTSLDSLIKSHLAATSRHFAPLRCDLGEVRQPRANLARTREPFVEQRFAVACCSGPKRSSPWRSARRPSRSMASLRARHAMVRACPGAAAPKKIPTARTTLPAGLRDGQGEYQFANGFFTYNGDWSEGLMHGQVRPSTA